MSQSAAIGWAGLSVLLIDTSAKDLTSINGAFGITSAEWSVVCFASGVLALGVGALLGIIFTKRDPTK